MSEIVIGIKNCNCIKEANIKIEEGTLNIKYGSNGLENLQSVRRFS